MNDKKSQQKQQRRKAFEKWWWNAPAFPVIVTILAMLLMGYAYITNGYHICGTILLLSAAALVVDMFH